MQDVGAISGKLDRVRLFARRGRVAVAIGLSVSAVALSGAIALPASGPADVPVAEAHQEPVRYLGIAADPQAGEAQQLAHPAELPAQRFTGRVGTNLTQSMLAAGVPERQGREYVAALSRAINLAGGLSVDDRFDLVIMRGEDGALGQLAYAGMDRIARADVELMKWTDGKQIIWVNGDGVGGETRAAMHMPVSGRVTSGFGSRFHPILGSTRFHKGVDLRATAGTPITAAADGRVVSAGWHGGYGRQVAIAHSGGIQTTYGHMSRIAASAGEMVRRGQVIGYVGSSGLSTGPHLHFEVLKNGRPVNPMSGKLGGGPGHLEGEKLREFRGELRGLLLLPRQG